MDNGKPTLNEEAVKVTTQYQAGILKDELVTEFVLSSSQGMSLERAVKPVHDEGTTPGTDS